MKDEQLKMEFIEKEIAAELASSEPVGEGLPAGITEKELNHAARTPFVLHNFDTPHDKEMAVFTCAKKLSEYIFVISEKSPKKFRWSIITRLQNASVDVVENLYRANFSRNPDTRIEYQRNALVSLYLTDFLAETARAKQAINMRQTGIIARQIAECRKLLTGWAKSTKNKKN